MSLFALALLLAGPLSGEILPPDIHLTGPSEGVVGESYLFEATAVGCNPIQRWRWTIPKDAKIVGDEGSEKIVFSTPGRKTVRVRNKGCPGVSGSVSIQISDHEPLAEPVDCDCSCSCTCEPP